MSYWVYENKPAIVDDQAIIHKGSCRCCNNGTGFHGVAVELISVGWNVIATTIPPNKITSITSPAGTLSLDTTAVPYKDGVPDANEDWKTPTLLNSWVNYGAGFYGVQAGLQAG